MLRTILTWQRSFLLVLLSLTGCRSVDKLFCNGAGCEWTKEEWARVQSLSNPATELGLPELPGNPSNAYVDRAEVVELGRMFYFDPRFSGNATLTDSIGRPVPYAGAARGSPINMSCATCHNPARSGGDFNSSPNTVSIGAGWYDVNGQQTVNSVFFADGLFAGGHRSRLYWNGRTDSLWAQAAQVNESGFSMNGDRANTYWVIVSDPRYLTAYNQIFREGQPELSPTQYTASEIPRHARPDRFNAGLNAAWACMTADLQELVTRTQVNFGKAIEAYERTLLGGNSPFDRFVREGPESDAISPTAKRGARLFVGKASCIDCHNGPLLSDGDYHNIGVPQTGDHVPTVVDCPQGSARCDCTAGAETSSCVPAGAWAGWRRLVEDGAARVVANRFATTSFTRNSEWADNATDPGDYCIQTDASYKGAWRTPSLRDVANTGPYMHDGYFLSLDDVVWHYNVGGSASGTNPFPDNVEPDPNAPAAAFPVCEPSGRPRGRAVQVKPLALTDGEMSDLVEFLKTLTSAPIALPDAGFDAGPSPDVGGAPVCATDGGGSQ